MKTQIITLATAAALTLGVAGFANSASAAAPSVNATAVANTANGNVQQVGYYYPGYGYRYQRRCRRLYRLGFIHGVPWARRAWYRNCRHRPYYPRYRGPRIRIQLGF